MPYKPAAVDENSLFAPRVETRLAAAFRPLACTRLTRPTAVTGLLIYETDTTNTLVYENGGWQYVGNRCVCTSATRPTGTSLHEGLIIFETDTDLTYTYVTTSWVQAGAIGELGYAEITSGYVNGAGADTDVPGLAITISVGTRPIWLEYGVTISHTATPATTGYMLVDLKEGTTYLQSAIQSGPNEFARDTTTMNGRRLTPTAGTHTYKIAVRSDVAGVQVVATTERPSWIRAVEL